MNGQLLNLKKSVYPSTSPYKQRFSTVKIQTQVIHKANEEMGAPLNINTEEIEKTMMKKFDDFKEDLDKQSS